MDAPERIDPPAAPDGPRRLRRGPRFWIRIASVLALGAGAAALALQMLRIPAATPVMRGRRVAEAHGCFACHGPGGIRPSPNLGAGPQGIPEWSGGTHLMYIETESDIRSWILNGRPGGHPPGAPWDPATDGALIPMPAYAGLLDGGDLEDLIAYFKAVAWYDPSIPREARQGRQTAHDKGCFTCHGAAGRDGLANPGSFKGYIPPWDGRDFAELVRDPAELRAWILEGSIPRFGENPVAAWFLRRQKIQMPAYREHLDGAELDAILVYIRWLRRDSGPPSGPGRQP